MRRFHKITDIQKKVLVYEHYESHGVNGMEWVASFANDSDADAFIGLFSMPNAA